MGLSHWSAAFLAALAPDHLRISDGLREIQRSETVAGVQNDSGWQSTVVGAPRSCYHYGMKSLGPILLSACFSWSAVAAESATAQAAAPKENTPAQKAADPLESEFRRLRLEAATANEEIEKWTQDEPRSPALTAKREQRLQVLRDGYQDLVRRYPNQSGPRLEFGSFLFELDEDDAAAAQWDEAKKLDPKNPVVWDRLADYYTETGATPKAFESLEKAIELAPKAAEYLQKLAELIDLFRPAARQYYHLEAPAEMDRVVKLYRDAIKLDPQNFTLATDFAQVLYGIRPFRVKEALDAWNYAFNLAKGPVEQQGVLIHLARVEINDGAFDQAAIHLTRVTLGQYANMKITLLNNIARKKGGPLQREVPFFQGPAGRFL